VSMFFFRAEIPEFELRTSQEPSTYHAPQPVTKGISSVVSAPLAIITIAFTAQDTILKVLEASQRATVRTRMGVNYPPRCEYCPTAATAPPVRGQGRLEPGNGHGGLIKGRVAQKIGHVALSTGHLDDLTGRIMRRGKDKERRVLQHPPTTFTRTTSLCTSSTFARL